MKVAALDLGTNTFILLVAEVEGGCIKQVIHDEVRVVRLGQGVHEHRRFHPDALKRADECFKDFSAVIRAHSVQRVLACATSAARDVANGPELIALANKHAIPVEIISGEREADLTFRGTLTSGAKGRVLIIDIGGGSTEFILGEGEMLVARKSLDIGSVRLTELCVREHPIPAEQLREMASYIDKKLFGLMDGLELDQVDKMIAVAGTPTTLTTLEQGLAFESEKVHGFCLKTKTVENWVGRLADMTIAQRQVLAGMEPKRADVIVAGAMILSKAAKLLGMSEVEVSVRGLRYGIALSLGELKN